MPLNADLDREVEEYLREAFEENFDWLATESGAGLAPDIKAMAFQQVLYYWRKLRHIARRVTETEVRLNLPGLESSAGREFGIEGVVDIVREQESTTMYDIKTHDPEYVRTHREEYASQLNVYSYIWETLREQALDETAVIATSFPEQLREALARGDDSRVETELERWQPVVPVPFDEDRVGEAIGQFGRVVDSIEEGKYSPRTVAELKDRPEEGARAFATRVCRNCDARFSCSSYRVYMQAGGAASDLDFKRFYSEKRAEWNEEGRYEALIESTDRMTVIIDLSTA